MTHTSLTINHHYRRHSVLLPALMLCVVVVSLLLAVCAQTEITDVVLREAVGRWITNEEQASKTYGHISTWDTRKITVMRELFKGGV